jgi:hypothetical protein
VDALLISLTKLRCAMYGIRVQESAILPVARNLPECRPQTNLIASELVNLFFSIYFKFAKSFFFLFLQADRNFPTLSPLPR